MKLVSGKMRYIFTTILLLGLFSCIPQIGLSNLEKLSVGMSPATSRTAMGAYPREVLEWSLAETGDTIIVQVYTFNAGGGPPSNYFLAYKNRSLIFWGYPHEFAKSSDPLIRRIGKDALSRYDKPR